MSVRPADATKSWIARQESIRSNVQAVEATDQVTFHAISVHAECMMVMHGDHRESWEETSLLNWRSGTTENRCGAAWSGLAFLLCAGFMAGPAHAAIETRDVLKTYFETGDAPTSQDFEDVLNIILNESLPGSYGITAPADPNGAIIRAQGSVIDASVTSGAMPAGLGPGWAGSSGYLGLALSISGATHYGYLQMSAGAAGTAELYPMFVEAFVWETVPGASITTAPVIVPEPGTLAMVTFGMILLASRRRQIPLPLVSLQ